MRDETNARLMGMQSTGSGRRKLRFAPMPRGQYPLWKAAAMEPEEIIVSIDKGHLRRQLAADK